MDNADLEAMAKKLEEKGEALKKLQEEEFKKLRTDMILRYHTLNLDIFSPTLGKDREELARTFESMISLAKGFYDFEYMFCYANLLLKMGDYENLDYVLKTVEWMTKHPDSGLDDEGVKEKLDQINSFREKIKTGDYKTSKK